VGNLRMFGRIGDEPPQEVLHLGENGAAGLLVDNHLVEFRVSRLDYG
jgi:hypothetical protein